MGWRMEMTDKKSMIAWADIGSHGKIFEFVSGPVAERYPHLLHIYSKKLTPYLVRVKITLEDK
jgi:hypothetical protein